jgi:hypothetical protein
MEKIRGRTDFDLPSQAEGANDLADFDELSR